MKRRVALKVLKRWADEGHWYPQRTLDRAMARMTPHHRANWKWHRAWFEARRDVFTPIRLALGGLNNA